MKNFIEEYWDQIESGEVVVSKKIRKTYEKLIYDLKNEDKSVYEFDELRANHVIGFIEIFCKHSSGAVAGKNFTLELWQKAMLSAVFGFVHKETRLRKYREMILIIARKNGKSALASAIALYMMIADGEGGAQVYSVATKKEQAKIVWEESGRMVKKSVHLQEKIKIRVNELSAEFNESFFKPLSSESNTLDGLNVHCSVIDELHAIKDKNLYDVIVDGMTAREQPLSVITTTSGTMRETIFDIKYDEATDIINGYFDEDGYKDDTTISFIYELDEREEWKDETMWQKANPGLGTIKQIDSLRVKVNKAKANSFLVRNLLTKDFNIPENDSQGWLSLEEAENKAIYDLKSMGVRYGIGGVDLSTNTDLTSACVLFQIPGNDTIFYKHMYWLPDENIEDKIIEDNIRYDIWIDKGYMRLSEGNTVNTQDVVDWFVEIQEEHDIYLYKVGYDSWGSKLFLDQMDRAFGGGLMVPVNQIMKTLSAPMKELGAQLKSKKINYNNNPITKWCITNVSYLTDKNDNIKPVKNGNSKRKIDGFACMLDSFVVYLDNKEDYNNII